MENLTANSIIELQLCLYHLVLVRAMMLTEQLNHYPVRVLEHVPVVSVPHSLSSKHFMGTQL